MGNTAAWNPDPNTLKKTIQVRSETAGRFCICTTADLPALTKFYLELFPDRRPEDLDARIPDTWWAVIKSSSGDIRLAAYVSDLGNMMVLVRPGEAESLDIQDDFVTLAQEVFKILKPFGVATLSVVYPLQLRRFVDMLEWSGCLKEAMLIREVRFTESGDVARSIFVDFLLELFGGLLKANFLKGESR